MKELVDILNNVKSKFSDDSDVVWTRYDTAKQLRDELDVYIDQLTKGDKNCLKQLEILFLPTASFQEHAISNGWEDEYLKLAKKFDAIYAKLMV